MKRRTSLVPLLFVLPLAACISIELPNLVADTTKAAKEAYQAVVPDKATAPAPAASAAVPRTTLSNAYVGLDTQSIAELRQACVAEAEKKLTQLSGKAVKYSVVENEVATIAGKPVANCKLMVEG
jgi:hypothetical protein